MTVVALLGFASLSFVAMFAVLLSTASLTGREPADLLLMGGVLLLIALCAALLAVAAWAFAHNGSHVGAVVAGGLLAGLGLLATLVGLTERDGGVLVVLGVVETVPGLIVAVLPFSGAATRYRARRRLALALADGAWAALEQERARDLAAWHGPIHLWAARFPGHPAPPHLAQPAPPHLAQPAPPPGQYPPYA
ncbi:hypothetical protein [Spirilliplanes yamanashiensis]|nr:hypothetical protein [Spirilliplanes yamanashiensis]MDP9819801.1 hypothetical protein [Spirilliplanes yamanashiensis]